MDYTVTVLTGAMQETTIDLREVMARCLRLPLLRELGSDRVKPTLVVRRSKRSGLRGRATYSTQRISITVPAPLGRVPPWPREEVEELVLHEVVHLVVDVDRRSRRLEHHGPAFRAALLGAAFEMWPEIRGKVRNEGRCYDMDARIWRCAWLGGQSLASLATAAIAAGFRPEARLPSVASDREVA